MRLNREFEVAMAVELIIAPEAQQDFDEAYNWYEDHRYGLGEEFLSCATPLSRQFIVLLNSMLKFTMITAGH